MVCARRLARHSRSALIAALSVLLVQTPERTVAVVGKYI